MSNSHVFSNTSAAYSDTADDFIPFENREATTKYNHSLALLKDKTLIAWGYNVNSQSAVPTNISDICAFAPSNFASVAITSASPLTIEKNTDIQQIDFNTINIVYPNPSEGMFQFSQLNALDRVQIMDATAKLVHQEIAQNESVIIQKLKTGMYFYEVIRNEIPVYKGKLIVR